MRSILCLLFLGFSAAAPAQTAAPSLSFKGNYLGMPLAEFRANNGGFSVWVNTGKPGLLGGQQKKFNRQLPTPLCTDEIRDFPGDSRDLEDDEVLCNASPGGVNPDGRTILGNLVLSQVVYRFFAGRLYAIRIQFMDGEYRGVAAGFRQKYGDAPTESSREYQNGFGARWKGEELIWHAGRQMVVLIEGPGNGPVRDELAVGSSAWFCDTSLVPRGRHPAGLDF